MTSSEGAAAERAGKTCHFSPGRLFPRGATKNDKLQTEARESPGA
jgi:hypothetical protein